MRYGDGIYISGASPVITGNTLSGVNRTSSGIFIAGPTDLPQISGNTISNFQYAIRLSYPDTSGAIGNNTAFNNGNNGIYFYPLSSSYHLTKNTTWRSNLPYIISNYNLVIDQSVTLTLEPGTVVKMTNGEDISVYGTLLSEGIPEQPIVFTSYYDDAYGGDTNGDG